mmetsp:Transcript_9037/g.25956  ORF Transcript_9037/g.25956 Transcript_9037/m.25956 type:complete len:704 (-) Transcript_9037:142-2253(-)
MMYKRDFGILLLSALAVYFSLQQEGTFNFRKAWYYEMDTSSVQLSDGILPPPVAADLNGDGSTEVLIATHDCKILLVAPQPHGRAGEGFVAAPLIAEASLLSSKVRMTAGRKAVTMATGYLDPEQPELVRALRKQVVVVVTAGWNILCFDHNLRLMWETSIRDSLPHHAEIREVAIHISNHTMAQGDRGVVVVGGGLELGDLMSHRGVGGGLEDEDVFDEEMEFEDNERRHSRSQNGNNGDIEGAVDSSRHFSYFAFDGRSGKERWSHQSKDFHRDAAELSEALIPQHNYRLDAESLNVRHYGEVSCRDFRESVLGAMPHRWSRLVDTRFELLHFTKHRHGKGPQKRQLGDVGTNKIAGGKHHGGKMSGGASGREHIGKDHSNPVASAVGKLAEAAMKGGRHHHKHLKDPHLGAPNVLVAHMEEGIEAIHLYTGRTLCKLHLPRDGLHADINGDGVLDHAMPYGGDPRGQTLSETGHRHIPNCWAFVNSGVPPREPLFNGTICRQHGLDSGAFASRSFGREQVFNHVEVAPPAMLPIVSHRHPTRGYLSFLNSRGEVTTYHGKKMWQVATGASWTVHSMDNPTHKVVPTLEALSLRPGAIPSALLAGGQHMAVVLSEHGNRLAQLYYPEIPILPLQMADFNADGLTDLILVTRGAVYGYSQVRHPGGMAFSALVGCLIVAMAVVFFTQTSGGKKTKRSTERAD